MSITVESRVPVALPDGKGSQTAVENNCKTKSPPKTFSSSISPVSVTKLLKPESVISKSAKIMVQKTLEKSVSGVSTVIRQLQKKTVLSSKKRQTNPQKNEQLPDGASLAGVKPRKRKLEDLQSTKPAPKKSGANLPPPSLASCNRHVVGANLRLPRSFTNCAPETALKYARMSFPFSDRHKCALVPTALFSYLGNTKTTTATNNQSQVSKSKYRFRRRVWLLVPHRFAPAGMIIRKVNGPSEPVPKQK